MKSERRKKEEVYTCRRLAIRFEHAKEQFFLLPVYEHYLREELRDYHGLISHISRRFMFRKKYKQISLGALPWRGVV